MVIFNLVFTECFPLVTCSVRKKHPNHCFSAGLKIIKHKLHRKYISTLKKKKNINYLLQRNRPPHNFLLPLHSSTLTDPFYIACRFNHFFSDIDVSLAKIVNTTS